MSLDQVKKETSASQFVLWKRFFEWETNAFDATRCYLAQIAAEIRRGYVKEPHKVKVADFIMKFGVPEKKSEEPKGETKEMIQTRANKMKSFFFALTGAGNKRKKRRG